MELFIQRQFLLILEVDFSYLKDGLGNPITHLPPSSF